MSGDADKAIISILLVLLALDAARFYRDVKAGRL
jgi:hypothetical protein